MQVEPLIDACQQSSQPVASPLHNFVPGVPVWEEYTCFDYAGLLQPFPDTNASMVYFHTTWSLQQHQAFTLTHQASLRSFLATQPPHTHLILWIHPNDELTLLANPLWLQLPKDRLDYRLYDFHSLIHDTPIAPFYTDDDSPKGSHPDQLKLLTLYSLGGVWFDLPTLFIRDLSPLLEQEWMAQGNCQSSMKGNPFTGAVWHFQPRSLGLCEMVHATLRHPDRSGPSLYQFVYRNILHHRIKPWTTLPWCFTDPSQCKSSNSLPSPTKANAKFDPHRLEQVFAFNVRPSHPLDMPGSIIQYLQQKWAS
ncbi:hypothetical protein DM01DRAFT_1337822 [Hesseltinella vesiculosa]|uniref:DUF5672 domain-containing protein n=1 Tax=Hesseltinella vesiculosa TaxID=101127 RepID=A0A1X2GBT8_9FUNG|nr:hypothetical protein DM01DRAFT_1337822 [Hesseltinella vesiculosa]